MCRPGVVSATDVSLVDSAWSLQTQPRLPPVAASAEPLNAWALHSLLHAAPNLVG